MFKSKGKYQEFGGVMIEGLVATSFLILTTFGIVEFAGFMKSNADISRILQQVAVGASQTSSCTSIEKYGDTEYLPDSEESFAYLQPNGEDSPIKKLALELLATNNLKTEDFDVAVDFFADGKIGPGGMTTIRTGYFWIGIKAKEKSQILGLIPTILNCHTLLAPIPTSFDMENPSNVVVKKDPLKGNIVQGCPDMTRYTPYEWKPIADSIDQSNTFCERVQ